MTARYVVMKGSMTARYVMTRDVVWGFLLGWTATMVTVLAWWMAP